MTNDSLRDDDVNLLGHALRLQAALLEEDGWRRAAAALELRADALAFLASRSHTPFAGSESVGAA